MNRNDDRDIYRSGANGIVGWSEQGSPDEERYGRERPRTGHGWRTSDYGQGSYGYGQGSSGWQGGYGGYQGSGYGQGGFGRGREYPDYAYGRDYGMGRDYGRDWGMGRDSGYGRDWGMGRDYGREHGRDFGGREYGMGREEEWYGRPGRERGWWGREHDRPGYRGRREDEDFWGRSRREMRELGDRIGDFFRGEDRDRGRYPSQREDQPWGQYRQEEPGFWEKMKGAFTGKGPKGYTRSDDRIREDVCERLTYHPYVDASEIEVHVKDGEVTLSGTVDDRGSKRLAEDITEDIRGVRDVHNQIRVRPQVQGVGTMGSTQTPGTTAGLSGSSSTIGTSSGNKR